MKIFLRIVEVLRIQLVLNLHLIWFVKLKHMHGNVWNVRHVQNVEILRMIQNFYFVTVVIGKFLYLLYYSFYILILVVIICIVVHLHYPKHLMVIGDVNYVAPNLANFDLDLFLCFFLYQYMCLILRILYVQSVCLLFVLQSLFFFLSSHLVTEYNHYLFFFLLNIQLFLTGEKKIHLYFSSISHLNDDFK